MESGTYGNSEYGKDTYDEASASQTHLPERWIERTRSMLEIPQHHESYRFFEAWQKSEGGTARWNPLNCTIAIRGTVDWDEGDYNSTGVKNYKYSIVGIIAIVLTMNQHDSSGNLTFGTLLKNLRNKNLTAEQMVTDSEADIKLWGTNPQTMLDVLKTIS